MTDEQAEKLAKHLKVDTGIIKWNYQKDDWLKRFYEAILKDKNW